MRTLLVVLLSLVALSMVITLIPGFGSPSMNTDDTEVLAVVGDDKVMARDIRNRIDELVRGQRLPPQLINAYLPQLIDNSIEERAEALMSRMLGNQLSDDELARVIQGSLPQLFENGAVDKTRYRDAVASMGRTVQQFEEDLRKNQLGLRLQNMAQEAAIVSPADVQAEYRRRNVKLKVEYVSYNADKLKSQITPDESGLRALFENSKSSYPMPEKRNLSVLVADESQIAQGLDVPEAALRAAYDQNRQQFTTPERVRARHILVKTEGKPDSEKGALKAKAESLLKQVKSGGNFAELAKANSDDTASAVKGGDLDWFGRGAMVPEFEKAAFELKAGEISGIVTTQYGYHIIQTQEKEPARTKPFEEVKGQLITQVQAEQVRSLTSKAIEDARAELIKNPAAIEQIAAKYKLQVIKADNIGPNGPLPSLGAASELLTAAFSAKQGEVSQVLSPQAGKLAAVLVTGITPARLATFEEARDRIADSYRQAEALKLAERKAKEASERLLQPGADWKAVAKSLGAELKTSAEFSPDGSIDGLGGASMLGDLLTKPVGSSAGPISIVGQYAVVKLIERNEPDPAKFEAEKVSIQMNLKSKSAQARSALVRDSLMQELLRSGKVKKNKKAIDRMLAQYSSL